MIKSRAASVAAAVVAIFIWSASAFAVPFTAPATSNIFAAGFGSTAGAGDGTGTLPPSILFPAGGGTLTFSGVTGTVGCGPFCANEASGPRSNGPDGAAYNGMGPGATNISAPGNGISGVSFNGREMFLVGVFLDNNTPVNANTPAIFAAYSALFADSATLYSPLIGQVFDIGNGLTGGPTDPVGIPQTYNIPVTATRLFIGFADAMGFIGAPGMYNDDTGFISGNVNLALNVTPEPGTLLLMGLGFAGLALVRRKVA
jgi:hypothetical protein